MSVSHAPVAATVAGARAATASGLPGSQAWPQGRDVHVWNIDLTAPAAGPSEWLDERELERARRFVYADDSRRYV
ncbi:MAG: hypothetical protein KGJ64_10655, partial [Betaproteobacteria bacterium]|nr:hypothetical protein [Betaproteobacteria bacterium]